MRTLTCVVRTVALLGGWLLVTGSGVEAAVIRGTTTTQGGTVRLPGVEVTVTTVGALAHAAVVISDSNGTYEARGLTAGRYHVVARLSGFRDLEPPPVALTANQVLDLPLDLVLAPLAEDVKVVGQAGFAQTETSVSKDTVKGSMIEYLPVAGEGYRALLPVVPGVVRAPDGRLSLKGARETQGALQLGRGYANDPSTGNFGMELPADSIESVEVASNPYAAEDGRFSSTVVHVETRPGTNQWHALFNGVVPIPCMKLCDGASVGIRNYRPRGWFGGPLVKDRLFIAQGAQYRFAKVRIPSLPEDANDTTDRGLETFTRLDANVSAGHTLSATVAFFPRRAEFVGLNTFLPAEASPNFRLMGYSGAMADSASLSPSVVLESSVTGTLYDATVSAQGEQAEELTIDGPSGNYFNTQTRRTRVVQWTESLTSLLHGGGEHVLRAGIDVMSAQYTGTSRSRPVVVLRANGTVSQRYEFGGPTTQHAGGADAAVFVQDRWRVQERLLFEPGVRLDRDGVLGRFNVSPRVGFVAGLIGTDTGVLRGGIGVFYERTPLNVAAFESFEAPTVTWFAADGVTPAGDPVTFVNRLEPLRTPRGAVWNLEYDHRLRTDLLVKVNHLERRSTDIVVVDPVDVAGVSQLQASSRGSAHYVETEVTLRYGVTELRQLSIAYVRSHSTSNQNVFDAYYGNVRTPIVRPDQYGLVSMDVPNRLLVSAAVTLRKKWTLSPLIEVRSGFPYSIVNEDQQFVGPRNGGGRFPLLYTFDFNIIRSATLLGREVRIGLRGYHLLNTFAPRDVQNNVSSPAFQTFYNSIPRRLSFTFTFLPR